MRFVETPIFTKVITALLDDESYRSLQSALVRPPEQGDLTPKQTRVLANLIREEFK